MNAQQKLATYGVSMDNAWQFIVQNANEPRIIFDVSKQYAISNEMLAEIVSYGLGKTITADDVANFFNSNGLNGNELYNANLVNNDTGNTSGGSTTGTGGSVASAVNGLDARMLDLATTNDNTGILSTASLKAAIIPKVGQAAYDKLFSVSGYDVNHDGVISTADFGGGKFANLPANQATVESLYFGTLIRTLKSIDMGEIMELSNFVVQNRAQLAAGDANVMASYFNLVYNMVVDPASSPLFTDQQIADFVINGTVGAAQVANGQPITLTGIFSADTLVPT